GPRDDAGEVPTQQPAVRSRANDLGGEGELGEKRQHVADHEQFACLAGRLDHGVGVLGGERDGLFDEDMLAGAQGRQGHGRVEVGGGADVDEIDVGVGEELVEVLVAFEVGEVHVGAGGAEITADGGPVAGEFHFVAAGQGGDGGALETGGGEVVDHAHEADA